MMARMPELSRRAILRLGVGAAAGAAGAYALGSALHTQFASVAGPPVSMTSAGDLLGADALGELLVRLVDEQHRAAAPAGTC